MARDEARRAATRAALLEQGLRLLHERGYTRTKAADVSAAAGVTTGAFFFHFADKEEFFLAVLDERRRQRGEWQERVVERAAPGTPLRDLVADALGEMARTMSGARSWYQVLADFSFEVRDRPDARKVLRGVYDGFVDEVERFVLALRDGGWLPGDADARRLATLVLALGQGVVLAGDLFDEPEPAGLADAIAAVLES